jgi:hypothetical protein
LNYGLARLAELPVSVRLIRDIHAELMRGVRGGTPDEPELDRAVEQWFALFLQGMIDVAAEAAETARRVVQLREKHRSAITARLGRAAAGGHKVLETLSITPAQSRAASPGSRHAPL